MKKEKAVFQLLSYTPKRLNFIFQESTTNFDKYFINKPGQTCLRSLYLNSVPIGLTPSALYFHSNRNI